MTDEEEIYLCAVRYGLGTMTNITSSIYTFMIEKTDDMSEECKSIMIRDIKKCEDYGHVCAKKNWMELLDKLETTPSK